MDRRMAIAATLGSVVGTAQAQNFMDILKKVAEKQAAPAGTPAKGPAKPAAVLAETRPRFEDDVPAGVYLQAYKDNFTLPDPVVMESPIRGLGLIKAQGNYEPMFVNADASFIGEMHWSVRQGNRYVALAPDEQEQIRLEVLKRVRWDMLGGAVWGGGAPRKALVFSAPDCPYCRAMEKDLVDNYKKLDYELYYLPTMLDKRSSVAKQVLCSPERKSAWFDAMLKRPLPPATNCQAVAYTQALQNIIGIYRQAGDKLASSTPTIVLESGQIGNWSSMRANLLKT